MFLIIKCELTSDLADFLKICVVTGINIAILLNYRSHSHCIMHQSSFNIIHDGADGWDQVTKVFKMKERLNVSSQHGGEVRDSLVQSWEVSEGRVSLEVRLQVQLQ